MRRRLGDVSYMVGADRRQIRVGKSKEPVMVLRLYEGAPVGAELVVTQRSLDFALFGMSIGDPEEQRAFLAWQQARNRAQGKRP